MTKASFDRLYIVGDIGGTNTNLAIVGHQDAGFTILKSARFSTQEEKSLVDPLRKFIGALAAQGFSEKFDSCCISGAGPVRNRRINLTNAPWGIDAAELESKFGFETHLINDFTAISYGVVLLDPSDSSQIVPLAHTDGTSPLPGQGMALVVGAGTGLGTGYIDKRADGSYLAYPSEGGHSEFSCADDLQYAFQKWLQRRCGTFPGVEMAVSGQGIVNIFAFLLSEEFNPGQASGYPSPASEVRAQKSETASKIAELPAEERPALIAAHRSNDPFCALTMELFNEFYARKVSGLSALYLPEGGVYLAGGISSKNLSFLEENHRFMRVFERNYAPHMRAFLSTVPVMVVRNYDISLIGAANAAYQFRHA